MNHFKVKTIYVNILQLIKRFNFEKICKLGEKDTEKEKRSEN